MVFVWTRAEEEIFSCKHVQINYVSYEYNLYHYSTHLNIHTSYNDYPTFHSERDLYGLHDLYQMLANSRWSEASKAACQERSTLLLAEDTAGFGQRVITYQTRFIHGVNTRPCVKLEWAGKTSITQTRLRAEETIGKNFEAGTEADAVYAVWDPSSPNLEMPMG